jgi:hypothetical protein
MIVQHSELDVTTPKSRERILSNMAEEYLNKHRSAERPRNLSQDGSDQEITPFKSKPLQPFPIVDDIYDEGIFNKNYQLGSLNLAALHHNLKTFM